MKYHVVSTTEATPERSNAQGAIFTNKIEAMAYQDVHPGSVYQLFDHWPDRIPAVVESGKTIGTVACSCGLEIPPNGPITVYTDGSCLGNPGPGGYGVVIKGANGTVHELAQGYRYTTNQRMELLGVIAALEVLNDHDQSITIVSDIRYAIDGLNRGWAISWRANGWKTTSRKPAKNPDLWERLLNLVEQFNDITFQWVKGHNGDYLNEMADGLATTAAASVWDHIVDEGYKS